MTNWPEWSLTHLGIRCDIVLVLLSNHFSTHQLINHTTTALIFSHNTDDQQPNLPVHKWTQHDYQANTQEIWGRVPLWTRGSRVDCFPFGGKTNPFEFRFMTWSSRTSCCLRSSKLLGWMTVRKLDLSHLCFSLNFHFLMSFRNFPLCFFY